MFADRAQYHSFLVASIVDSNTRPEALAHFRDPGHLSAVGTFRLGVLLDRPDPPRWIRKALDMVLPGPENGAEPLAVLTFVGVLQYQDRGEPRAPRSQAPLTRWLYDRLDRWRAAAHLEILAAERFGERQSDVAVKLERDSVTLPGSTKQQLNALGLDVLLVFSNRLRPSAVASCARLGAGGFVLSDYAESGGIADGLQEVLNGESVVTVRLEWFTPDADHPSRVFETSTNADRYSAALTHAYAAWHCIPLVERLLSSLKRDPFGTDSAEVRKTQDRIERTRARTREPLAPGLASLMLKFGSSRFASSRVLKGADVQRWEIGYKWIDPATSPVHAHLNTSGFRPLQPPRDRLWADPFPMRIANRYFVLFEELRYADDRGYICALEIGPDGAVGDRVVVLERPYHLSYPFLFEYGGQHYMIPETSLEGRLELYRAVTPPFEWTFDRVLMDGAALIDTTIAEIEGEWWLFGCRLIPGLREWTDLMIYRAATPFGPWIPHERNPVISDVRYARPAGALYRHDGAWYRPAQDCSRIYGGALSIRRISRLSISEYDEEEVARLDPDGSGEFDGAHTVNCLGALCIIDRKRRSHG